MKDMRSKSLKNLKALEFFFRRGASVAIDHRTHVPIIDKKNNTINTFVDCMNKWVQLVASREIESAEEVIKASFDNVFWLHGLPEDLVPDQDPNLSSRFLKWLAGLCRTLLKMATSRHSQTDGSTESMNRMIGSYLCCSCAQNRQHWKRLLNSAEFANNSDRVETMKISSFVVNTS